MERRRVERKRVDRKRVERKKVEKEMVETKRVERRVARILTKSMRMRRVGLSRRVRGMRTTSPENLSALAPEVSRRMGTNRRPRVNRRLRAKRNTAPILFLVLVARIVRVRKAGVARRMIS